MKQLFKQSNGNKALWSTGWASYFTDHKAVASRLPVAVRCRIGNLEVADYALLDTGAESSVIGGETAENLIEQEIGHPIESIRMSTRLGLIEGELHRMDIRFIAEQDSDADLTVHGTILVTKEWEGPIVLGYRGLLERMRFAIDPGAAPGQQIFYFGANE